MSKWEDHDMLAKVTTVLREDVPLVNAETGHTYGRPYLTTYQLAIKLQRRYDTLAEGLGMGLGGAGSGGPKSLARYLGKELSRVLARRDPTLRIEGAFLSNSDVREMTFTRPDGGRLVSSATGSGYDVSLFRYRSVPDDEA